MSQARDTSEDMTPGGQAFGSESAMRTESGVDDTWVVIPLYNEEQVIGDVVAGVRTAFPQVVCIDDGSTDRPAAVAAARGAPQPRGTCRSKATPMSDHSTRWASTSTAEAGSSSGQKSGNSPQSA